jgi:hypothetical protein
MTEAQRRAHSLLDALTAEGRAALEAGFQKNLSYRKIAIELRKLGFPISEATVARAGRAWRDRERRRRGLQDPIRDVVVSGQRLAIPRRTHTAVDELPPEARAVMVTGFEQNLRYAEITAKLRAMGTVVSGRVIERAGFRWQAARRRKEVLASLDAEVLAVGLWRVEELVGIVESLDLAPGSPERGRKKVARALAEFFRAPSGAAMKAIERELFSFLFASYIVARRPSEGGAGSGNEMGGNHAK